MTKSGKWRSQSQFVYANFSLTKSEGEKKNDLAAHLTYCVIQMARLTSAERYDCARRQHSILQLNL